MLVLTAPEYLFQGGQGVESMLKWNTVSLSGVWMAAIIPVSVQAPVF
jgi:hypothetical protein